MKKLLACLLALMLCLPCAMAEHAVTDIWFCDEDYIQLEQGGLWGMMDFDGQWVLPCEWEALGEPQHGYVPVQRGGLWGVVDLAGNPVIPCEWDGLWVMDDDTPQSAACWFAVERGGLTGLLATDGTMALPLAQGVIGQMGAEPYPLFRGTDPEERTYYLLVDGIAVETTYSYTAAAKPLPEGYVPTYYALMMDFDVLQSETDGLYYLFDSEREMLDGVGYEDVKRMSNGFMPVQHGGKWGFVDESGMLALPCVYDGVGAYFREERASVRQGENRFWIDTQGSRIADYPWDGSTHFNRGVAMVKKDGLWGLIDREGNVLAECQWTVDTYTMANLPFSSGEMEMVMKDGLCGFINLRGEEVIPCAYEAEAMGASWLAPKRYSVRGDRVAILYGGVLTIWNAVGEQIY